MSKSLDQIRKKYQEGNIPMVEYHGKFYTPDADYVQYRKEMNGKINAYNFDSKLFKTKVNSLDAKLEYLDKLYRIAFIIINIITDAVLLYLFFTEGIEIKLFNHYWKIAGSTTSLTCIIDVVCVLCVVFAISYLLAKCFVLSDEKIITESCGFCSEEIKQYCDIFLVSTTEYNNLVAIKNEEEERERIERERREREERERCEQLERERKEREERERIEKERIERERAAEEERRRQEYERSLAGQYEAMKQFMAANPEYVRERQQQELAQMEREAQERLENVRRMEYEAEERDRERQRQRENENKYGNIGRESGAKILSATQRGNEVYVYGQHGLLYSRTGCRLINWTSDSVTMYTPNVSGPFYDIYDAHGSCIGHTPSR